MIDIAQDIADALNKFMLDNGYGVKKMAKLSGISHRQILSIKRGEANLTLASIAQLAAAMKKRPRLIFEDL